MKIFYADDDQEEIDIFCEVLNMLDSSIECITAENGEAALKILNQIDLPDYIFLDINMPRINGNECLRAIKNDKRLGNVPVIIYSTSIDPKETKTWYQNGASKVIAKQGEISKLKKDLELILTVKSLSANF